MRGVFFFFLNFALMSNGGLGKGSWGYSPGHINAKKIDRKGGEG